MNLVSSLMFQSPAVRFSGAKCDFAHANCFMEFFVSPSGHNGQIEWLIKSRTGCEQAIYIDLYFANNHLLDFCGIDVLPLEAIKLLRYAGYVVDNHSCTPF